MVARPRVTMHNTVSVDGRLTGFPVDLGLHYEVLGGLPHDAVLAGSGTLLAAARTQGVDVSVEGPAAPPGPAHAVGPWLVIVDSRARLVGLSWLRDQPYWRDVLILCSQATPAEHRDRLHRQRVEHVVAGADHVDLAAALRVLADRYGVGAVCTDAGGTLNGHLLLAGLVDEISLVVAPYLAGAGGTPLVHPGGGAPGGRLPRLELVASQPLRDHHLWLRYRPGG
jgi:2,5-diamino-6-(ribosylamino)-4(3H)-pyrimidinone 5'-phosphate reductase